jgi:hypothetical protein
LLRRFVFSSAETGVSLVHLWGSLLEEITLLFFDEAEIERTVSKMDVRSWLVRHGCIASGERVPCPTTQWGRYSAGTDFGRGAREGGAQAR